MHIVETLEEVLQARKNTDPKKSYVASLYASGDDAILKKIIEEAAETIIAVKNNDDKQIVHEITDLYFHILVLLSKKNISINRVYDELEKRFGVSGVIEKQQRTKD